MKKNWNIEKKRASSKAWREANQDRVLSYYLRKFKITVTEWKELLQRQNECCALCGIHQSLLNKRLAVDHDHVSGKIRGLLCFKCNTAIGLLNDDVTLVTKLVTYLTN